VNGSILTESFTYDDYFKSCLKTWTVEGQSPYSCTYDPRNGNILSKTDFTNSTNYYQYSTEHPHALEQVINPVNIPEETQQNVTYNLAKKSEEN
jgi:hypothetical protein